LGNFRVFGRHPGTPPETLSGDDQRIYAATLAEDLGSDLARVDWEAPRAGKVGPFLVIQLVIDCHGKPPAF